MKAPPLARSPIVVSRPRTVAAEREQDALFTARAALRRACEVRQAAEIQVDQLRALIERLQGQR